MATHIRGDSFDKVMVLPSDFEDGHFIGWTVSSQVRVKGTGILIADLVCAWIGVQANTRSMSLSAIDTSSWPVGQAEFSVSFTRTADGFTQSTSAFPLTIANGVTRK